MSGSIIYKDLLVDLFNLSDGDIQNVTHENQNGKTVVFVTLVPHHLDCPDCGYHKTRVKGYVNKIIKHSILTDRSCVIHYKARRYVCPICGRTFYEGNPFVFGRMKISIFTLQKVLIDLKNYNETFSSVARRYHISATSVANIFENHVLMPRKKLSKRLNFDEVYAFKSVHSKYVCVIFDHDEQIPIDILPSRRYEFLKDYFMKIPIEERMNVEMCCFDMYDTYRSICRWAFPNATMVVDHFHVIQELTRQLTQVRITVMKDINIKRQTAKKEIRDDPEALKDFRKYDRQYYCLKKFNWLLFKDKNDPKYFSINASQKYNAKFQKEMSYNDYLDIMLACHEQLKEAYRLKNAVTDFYRYTDYEHAPQELAKLIQRFTQSSIQQYRGFARTMTKWKIEIIQSFIIIEKEYTFDESGKEEIRERKMTNAIIENKNAIIKCIKKNANGYTNWERFRNRIMYVLDPKATFSLYPIKKE